MQCQVPNVTVVKVYRPQDGQIHVHQTRVTVCPKEFPAGYYWYGNNSKSTDCVPEWVNQLLNNEQDSDNCSENTELFQGDLRGIENPEEIASETGLMESEMEPGGVAENQLDRGNKVDDDDVGTSAQHKEDLTNRQFVTPYSLRPRLQPPTRFK